MKIFERGQGFINGIGYSIFVLINNDLIPAAKILLDDCKIPEIDFKKYCEEYEYKQIKKLFEEIRKGE